jgi:Asp/Glu/hydantoin racemase
VPDAYDALLAGDFQTHDARLLEGISHLVEQHVNAVVLAQVSMARIMKQLNGKFQVPVLTSLHTSLSAVRETLGMTQ